MDISALIHVYSRAIGCSSLRCRRIEGPFDTKPIVPFGWPYPTTGEWSFHQVGVTDDVYVYDACIILWRPWPYNEWQLAVGGWEIDANEIYYDLLYDDGDWEPSDTFDYTQVN